MIWYEFFAGGGMARLGLGDEWQCAFANEWCPKKAAAYTRRFGSDELRVGDIAKLTDGGSAGRRGPGMGVVSLSGSLARGRGAGLEGARSGTFHAFWNLIDGLARGGPRAASVVLENVVGAITSHGGRDFAEILGRMAATGYFVRSGGARCRTVAAAVAAATVHRRRARRVPAGLPGIRAHARAGAHAHDAARRLLRKRWIWWDLPEPAPRTIQLKDILEDTALSQWHSPSRRDICSG